MRKMLLAATAAMALLATTTTTWAADYAAVAASPFGYGLVRGGHYTMENAGAAAVNACRTRGGSCSVSTAEESNWFFSIGYCNGIPYTAASPQGLNRADEIVFLKGNADGDRKSTRLNSSHSQI